MRNVFDARYRCIKDFVLFSQLDFLISSVTLTSDTQPASPQQTRLPESDEEALCSC